MLKPSSYLGTLIIFLYSSVVVFAQTQDDLAIKIIVENCLECHSGAKPKGGLDLSTRENLFKGGDNGPGVEINNLLKGQIQEVLDEGRMPPKKTLDKKSSTHLKSWITSGAKYPTSKIDIFSTTTSKRAGKDWWSLRPLQNTPFPTAFNNALILQPLDSFIFDNLKKLDLKPSELADRRTLIRRVFHDLIGTPPTPEEVSAFLKDQAPNAFSTLVEKLLASPHYGEKWARHWLDIVRYGESDGFERNNPRINSWHYRDWVIKALNSDMPYDQFVQMQIAGDTVATGSEDSVKAMGFLVAGIHNTVLGSNADAKEQARQDEMEDLVSSIGQTFLGLTVNCARCHDHKFDPISQQDYYKMVASLSGIRHGEVAIPNALTDQKILTLREKTNQLLKVQAELEKSVLAKIGIKPDTVISKPIAQWDFRKNLNDSQNNFSLKLEGGAKLTPLGLELDGKSAVVRSSPLKRELKEKTLETLVLINNLEQRGGGVLTIETHNGTLFDSIVFAEQSSGKWMAGSNFFQRTQPFNGDTENETHLKPIHLAITYSADGKITAYRNGKIYGNAYKSNSASHFPAGDSIIAFGIRHEPPGGNRHFAGTIVKARVFDKALNDKEVKLLFDQLDTSFSEKEFFEQLTPPQLLIHQENSKFLLQLAQELKAHESKKTNASYSAVSSTPVPTKFLNRGQVTDPGREVYPGNLQALSFIKSNQPDLQNASDKERRFALAKWITNNDNPLFSRVIVNRIWHYHFGAGIVDTPSDFGFNGSKPSHPELLDYLSEMFVRSGYSLKQLHRTILLSRTYQQSSRPNFDGLTKDFDNRLLWRWSPRRLDGEVIRDSALQVCGLQNQEMNGASFSDYKTDFFNGTNYFTPIEKLDFPLSKRSIYRFTPRGANQGLLDSFDCPDNSSAAPKRSRTTTPAQTLAFWNGSFTQYLADSYPSNFSNFNSLRSSELKVKHIFMNILQRNPSEKELTTAINLIEKHEHTPLIRSLLNTNEFLTLE